VTDTRQIRKDNTKFVRIPALEAQRIIIKPRARPKSDNLGLREVGPRPDNVPLGYEKFFPISEDFWYPPGTQIWVRKLKFGDLSVINKAITTDNQTTLMDALGPLYPSFFGPPCVMVFSWKRPRSARAEVKTRLQRSGARSATPPGSIALTSITMSDFATSADRANIQRIAVEWPRFRSNLSVPSPSPPYPWLHRNPRIPLCLTQR
jgi:hypothetical protein